MAYKISFNVSLIGGPRTGKTTFVRRWFDGQYYKDYVPTTQFSYYPFTFGNCTMNVLDGQHSGECYAAIAFYTPDTIDETNRLVEIFKERCPTALILNVWSFSDLKDTEQIYRKLSKQGKMLQGGRKSWIISGKSNYNFDKPFLEIMREITRNPEWNFPLGNFVPLFMNE